MRCSSETSMECGRNSTTEKSAEFLTQNLVPESYDSTITQNRQKYGHFLSGFRRNNQRDNLVLNRSVCMGRTITPPLSWRDRRMTLVSRKTLNFWGAVASIVEIPLVIVLYYAAQPGNVNGEAFPLLTEPHTRKEAWTRLC